MDLENIIYKRQSSRNYLDEQLTEDIINDIHEFIKNTKKLDDSINFSYYILSKDEISTRLPWKSPNYISIYSVNKSNYLQNIGFIFQQLDLYLNSIGIGSCWLGMAKPKKDYAKTNEEYIITIAIGKVKGQLYRSKEDFDRLNLEDISDFADEKLEPALYAPSATNSQPWYFTHNDKEYNIYRKKFNIVKRKFIGRWNEIDIGISLAHLYVSSKDSFKFNINDNSEKLDGYYYEGSFII